MLSVVHVCRDSQAINQSVVFIDNKDATILTATECTCMIKAVKDAHQITISFANGQSSDEFLYQEANEGQERITNETHTKTINGPIKIFYTPKETTGYTCLKLHVDTGT
jgi:hypothetical protein